MELPAAITILDTTYQPTNQPIYQRTQCQVLGSTARGGALSLELPAATSLSIAACTFTNNTALPGLPGLDPINGYYSALGARGGAVAVLASGANVSVQGCKFSGNSALGAWGSGGALSVVQSQGTAEIIIQVHSPPDFSTDQSS